MKKRRKNVARKLLAVCLLFCMVLGMIPGNLTVAFADGEEDGGENDPITGFAAVYPDWDGNGTPSFPEDQEAFKSKVTTELGREIQGTRSDMYFGVIDDQGKFTKLTEESKLVAGEGLTVTKWTDDNGQGAEGLFTVSFKESGSHTLTYNDGNQDYTMNVNVVDNRIKIYEDEAHTKEFARDDWGNYMWDNDGDGHSADCTIAYVVIKQNEGECIDSGENMPFNSSQFGGQLSIKSVYGKENEYKITRTEGNIECDPVVFKIKGHIENETENTFEQEVQILVHFQGAGLRVTFDFVENGGNVTGVADDAYWDNSMCRDINDKTACFAVFDAKGQLKNKIIADRMEIYEATRSADGVVVPAANPTENVTITQNEGKEWVTLQFKKDGLYIIRLKDTDDPENRVELEVTMPAVGLYSKPKASVDAYLPNYVEFGKTAGDNVFYLIARDEEWASYNKEKEPVFSCDGAWDPALRKFYMDVESVTIDNAAKAYKITITKKSSFHLETSCEYLPNEGESFDKYAQWIDFEYKGSQPDMDPEETPNELWRYEGEDGKDYIGYSGRYITEEAYLKGNIWFPGATPDNVCYWVHGATIQEVVDALLELDGKEVTVYDSKEKKETEVTIRNSGFLFVNMSYRDKRYQEAAEAEQYVYAPASVKGVMLETASNSYSVALKSPDGNELTDEETKNPIYDTVYEFPLTTDARTSMKQYDCNGTEETAEYDITDNEIAYLHGIILQDWYLKDYNDTFAQLIKKQEEANKNSGEDERLKKYIIQQTEYNEQADSWQTTDTFYLISAADSNPDGEDHPIIDQCAVIQKDQHRWPSLHVNASTQVRIVGLWKENAKLHIGFYDADSVCTYVADQKFSYDDIGTTKNVNYQWNSVEYDPSKKHMGEESYNTGNQVKVYVVKAESNTKVDDTYSEDGKSASLDVEKEALSDLVPMTSEEQKALIDGASLDIDLKVSGMGDSTNQEAVKAQNDIKRSIGSNKVADFFQAFLNYTLKKADGTAIVNDKSITEAREDMILSFPLKAALQGKTNYVVYRYHDGKTDKLNAWIDENTGNLCFETDRFSVYAIAADDGNSGGSPSSGGSSLSGGSSSPSGGTTVDPGNKKDDTKTEVKPDGTVVETKPDGTSVETKAEASTNSQGNEVKSETTTVKNADGTVALVTVKIEITDTSKDTTLNAVVVKDASGNITEAKADVESTAKAAKSGKAKTKISADTVSQVAQATGTKDITIQQTVKDDKGNVLYTVETDAKNLAAGKKLTLVQIKDGEKVLVTKPARVDKDGNFTVNVKAGEYQLLNESETKALRKQILATVKPEKKAGTVKKGQKIPVNLSKKLDMDNVAKITYQTSDKSVAAINKNGKVTGKKKGKVTVKITITLNDGTKKTIKTKITVK